MFRIKGFTLIELMVVVALVAIIATIAVPSFGILISDNRAESQAEELNSLLQYARSEAVIRKVTSTVAIDTGTAEITVSANGQPLRSSVLSLGNVVFATTATTLSYHPNGTASTPSFRAIFCSDNKAATGRLLTVSASGATKLHHKGKKPDGSALGSCSI
ncbi:prepilin-type N-terminal cleavage/methylation domain-containing protein [Pseudomonas sp. gcc21]|uniref:GspH/FimT family pseudopilin n=1 Tax=Pseudomonas sp. gcc21 TaxID=2726989 RepID=UPI001452689F|nr:GspH/FimT family pseudopilin [Pseudomonas sp. gcc21]QJD60840.1 prepilin-type N-terminal cleavage/methylation domain-containing protein [Pseudomonas sp. gcc21]